MSTKEIVVSETNPYVRGAQTLLQQLREMRDVIPHFVIPESRKERTRLSKAASVPPEFVELTAVAVTNEKELLRGGGNAPAEVRDLMSYAEAYNPLADELEALANFVRFSVTTARNKAGSEALTTYSLTQRLAKRPETAHLAPYAADMRRALGRPRKPSAATLARRALKKQTTPAIPHPS